MLQPKSFLSDSLIRFVGSVFLYDILLSGLVRYDGSEKEYMIMDMKNKIVLITGGASGIGRASAFAFAKSGASVYIINIDIAGANAVVDEIVASGGENANKNIRINCVCPGVIQTKLVKRVTKGLNELHPMNRIGQPEEVANAVIWLCSDDSSFITGHSLVIDGG